MKRWIAELVDAKSKIGAISRGRGGHDARLNRRRKPLDVIILLVVTGVVAWGRRQQTMNLLTTATIKIELGNGKELSKQGV
jgi:hypothetical protein